MLPKTSSKIQPDLARILGQRAESLKVLSDVVEPTELGAHSTLLYHVPLSLRTTPAVQLAAPELLSAFGPHERRQ